MLVRLWGIRFSTILSRTNVYTDFKSLALARLTQCTDFFCRVVADVYWCRYKSKAALMSAGCESSKLMFTFLFSLKRKTERKIKKNECVIIIILLIFFLMWTAASWSYQIVKLFVRSNKRQPWWEKSRRLLFCFIYFEQWTLCCCFKLTTCHALFGVMFIDFFLLCTLDRRNLLQTSGPRGLEEALPLAISRSWGLVGWRLKAGWLTVGEAVF